MKSRQWLGHMSIIHLQFGFKLRQLLIQAQTFQNFAAKDSFLSKKVSKIALAIYNIYVNSLYKVILTCNLHTLQIVSPSTSHVQVCRCCNRRPVTLIATGLPLLWSQLQLLNQHGLAVRIFFKYPKPLFFVTFNQEKNINEAGGLFFSILCFDLWSISSRSKM